MLEWREACEAMPRMRPGAGESWTLIFSLHDVSWCCVSWQLWATFMTCMPGNGTAQQGLPAVGLSGTIPRYQRCMFFIRSSSSHFASADDNSSPAKVVSAPPSPFLPCGQNIIFLHVSNTKSFIMALSIPSLNSCYLFCNTTTQPKVHVQLRHHGNTPSYIQLCFSIPLGFCCCPSQYWNQQMSDFANVRPIELTWETLKNSPTQPNFRLDCFGSSLGFSSSVPPGPLFLVQVLVFVSCLLAQKVKTPPGSACSASRCHPTHTFITSEREKHCIE